MIKIAFVQDGVVKNVVNAESLEDVQVPDGFLAYVVPDDVGVGYTRTADGSWLSPDYLPPLTPEQILALAEAAKDQQIVEIDQGLFAVLLKVLFNHENRLRAMSRGVRAVVTSAQRTTLDNQGVEPARADATMDQAKTFIRSLL